MTQTKLLINFEKNTKIRCRCKTAILKEIGGDFILKRILHSSMQKEG